MQRWIALACGFQQELLDQVARQGYANAMFDQDEGDDGMQVVEEFYPDDAIDSEQILSKSNQGDGFVQDIQQGLQRSVRAVN